MIALLLAYTALSILFTPPTWYLLTEMRYAR